MITPRCLRPPKHFRDVHFSPHLHFSPPPSPPGPGAEVEQLLIKVDDLQLREKPTYSGDASCDKVTRFFRGPTTQSDTAKWDDESDMPPCPPSPPPEAFSPPPSPPVEYSSDEEIDQDLPPLLRPRTFPEYVLYQIRGIALIICASKLHRPFTPAEQLLGERCRSNSDGDGPSTTSPVTFTKKHRGPDGSYTAGALGTALTIAYGIAYPNAAREHDPSLLIKLIDSAHILSLSHGSSILTPSGIMESAWGLRPTTVPLPLVIEVLPLQYDSMFAGLTDIHKDCDALEAEGIGRPLILVIGDIYGVVASMFRAAGADVATTDTRPSEVSHIPHHQGSSSRLQDAGFDLVIVLENGSPPPPFNKHSKPRPNAPYLATETPAVGQYSNNSCPVGMGVGQVSQLVFP